MKVILLTINCLFSCWIIAQDKPLVSSGELQFYIDCVSFVGKDSKTFQEFHLMLYADQLHLIKKENQHSSIIIINTSISDKNKQISQKEWTTFISFDSLQDIKTKVVYDEWQEMLDPGEYSLKVKISDPEKLKSGVVESKISVPEFNVRDFSLSGIKFISNIIKSDSVSDIIPNPARRYGILNPTLYFYYELYLTEKYRNQNLSVIYQVINESGKIIKSLSGNDVNSSQLTIGYTQAIDVSNIPSGVYTFAIEVSDISGNKSVRTEKLFEVIQPDYLANTNLLSEKDSKTLGKILEYIATPQEVDFYKQLNSSAKGDYIVNFFKRKDPSRGTSENEYLNAIIARYKYSNNNFQWGSIEGASTERGRVFIQNGKPDEIVYHNSGMDTTPYEIWYYRTNREYYYIFADIKANGQYVLVHSSKEGEIKNQSWKQQVLRD